jgi:TonB family protein
MTLVGIATFVTTNSNRDGMDLQKITIRDIEAGSEPKLEVTPPPKQEPPKKKEIEKPLKKVFGMEAKALSNTPGDNPNAMAIPLGNSLSVPDEGIRLTPEQASGLSQDLSSDAKLILDSIVKPAYTPEAVDANLEGRFSVDVFVEADGRVSSAELPRKIGYGMDKKVIEAALQARFKPRTDRLGRSIAGWANITFSLVID